MRKLQQKQLLALTQTLNEAHDEMRRLISRGDLSAAIQVLSDCQEFTLQMGRYIEAVEGEGTHTVSLLEEYHEALHGVSFEISKGTAIAGTVKRLGKRIIEIENSIKNELRPSKIEVAFFPYKASMWDSLESIWLAAKDDPLCDAYVVPIPYYDKYSGGRLGQMHYEGDLYPHYVPIVDWHEYNVEARQPDIIFIHNPYDQYNLVTEIHPYFFSSRLEALTALLVYVPYFSHYESVPGNTNEVFILLPGIFNSDVVAVESAAIRKKYIRTLEKAMGKPGVSGILAKKVVALGSPKLDKVINSKPEDFTLPDEWSKLFVNPEGRKRTVVLYNLRLTDMTAGIEKQLDKLEYVISMFEKQNDVVLWMRPHPLNISCLQSMRPHFLDKYVSIVDRFKKGGWGIYDETPELHRAIAFSDAYFGDQSSLIVMYEAAGKPAIIQNIDILADSAIKLARNILLGSMCAHGNYLWVTALIFNGLFRIDRKTWETEFVSGFPGETLYGTRIYTEIVKYKNKLFFTPHRAENIAIYNIDDSCFDMVPIPAAKKYENLKRPYDSELKFVRMFKIEDLFYLIPRTYPGILIYDPRDESFEVIDDWLLPLNEIVFDAERGYFHSGVIDAVRSVLILSCLNANALVEIDLMARTSSVYKLGDGQLGYGDMLLVDGDFWLISPHKTGLTRCDCAHGVTQFDFCLDNTDGQIDQLQRIIHIDGCIFLIPAAADKMLRFNIETETFSVVQSFKPNPPSDNPADWANPFNFLHTFGGFNDGKIYSTTGKTSHFIEFDPLTGSLREECIKITKESNLQKFREAMFEESCILVNQQDGLVFRETRCTLPFMNRAVESAVQISKKAAMNDVIVHKDGKAGEAIWEHCKNEVLY